jgi:hypothetical protein
VETPSGDFAAARAVLERMLVGHTRGRDEGSTSTIHTDTPPAADFFFHSIGELELMAEVRIDPASFGENQNSLSKSLESERQAHEHEARRKAIASTRAAQLEAFMSTHPALFPMTPQQCGRLNAFFTWKEGRAKAAAGR